MKKVFCIILALTLMMSLAACSQPTNIPAETSSVETPSVETEAPTAPTMAEATTENVTIYESVTFDNILDYETKIHDLGFAEFKIDICRPAYDSGPACIPTNLEFADGEFKLSFDYYVLDYEINELKLVQGWTLYGKNNQSEATNFSDYKESDYENVNAFENTNMSSDFVKQTDYSLYNIKDNIPEHLIICTALYYPASNNAYNLVYKYEDAMNITNTVPYVLAHTQEDMSIESVGGPEDYNISIESEPDTTELLVMKVKFNNEIVEYTYEAGMTLTDWAKTSYNVDHWLIFNDGCLYSEDREWCLSPIDVDIITIETVDGVIIASPSR